MTAAIVLVVVALFQGAFIVLLVMFLGVRRVVDRARRQTFEFGRYSVSAPLNAWLAGSGGVEPVVAALRALPGASALGFTGNLARTTIPWAQRGELAAALRGEPWVQHALRGASSRRWGRRLEAARCLALVGEPSDGALLEALLDDAYPAVAIAAVAALPRVADAQLVGMALDRLVSLPNVVRLYLQGTLRELRTIVGPALASRLLSDAPPRSLARWAELAGALEIPAALDCVPRLATHPTVRVRIAVARALRRAPRAETVVVLQRMLLDEDHGVRAVAARSLGELASTVAIPALLAVAHDSSWIVRYRAVLALSQLGEPGRNAVRMLRSDSDRYVAEMATLITGLGDGALLDMMEA